MRQMISPPQNVWPGQPGNFGQTFMAGPYAAPGMPLPRSAYAQPPNNIAAPPRGTTPMNRDPNVLLPPGSGPNGPAPGSMPGTGAADYQGGFPGVGYTGPNYTPTQQELQWQANVRAQNRPPAAPGPPMGGPPKNPGILPIQPGPPGFDFGGPPRLPGPRPGFEMHNQDLQGIFAQARPRTFANPGMQPNPMMQARPNLPQAGMMDTQGGGMLGPIMQMARGMGGYGTVEGSR